MKNVYLFLFAAWMLTASIVRAQNTLAPGSGGVADESAAGQVKLTISNEKPDAGLLIPEKDLLEADFRGDEPEMIFPNRALHDNVFEGRAAVGVMLDVDGNATDFLIIRYTQPCFAEELMRAIQHCEFMPRRVKSEAVPGRFFVVRAFVLSEHDPRDPGKPATVAMNPMEQIGSMSDRISNSKKGPKFAYKAREEAEIDGHLLKAVTVVAPVLPAGYIIQPERPVKVVVSFYVDEKGNVRLPNVDSNTPAAIAACAIKAVSAWKFVSPTINGKPVLVFTQRTLTLSIGASAVGGGDVGK